MSGQETDIAELDRIDKSQLPPDGGTGFNRLIFSSSPYLLQHARNPVDWYPWGDEALERARREEKPIFLSIGYSTCHWCHVMAHESFEDETVATVLSRDFVAIKVDREERPDIDNTYMMAAQMMTGSGGWPLTLVLTPDKQPFFAATYIPRDARQGMPGLVDLLQKILEVWQTRRDEVLKTGQNMVTALQQIETLPDDEAALDERPLRRALGEYRTSYDTRNGGFGGAPKFPAPHNLSLLFRLGQRLAMPDAGQMAADTLLQIRAGSIYDQIGHGLHRYSVDESWRIPHFEKMLYDQALFISAALDAWQVTGDPRFKEMAVATATYLKRDMRDPEGGLHAGEDADSEGAEGTYYLWTPDQVRSILEPDLAEIACRYFGIRSNGNFAGRSIPFQATGVSELAADLGLAEEDLADKLEKIREQLFVVRSERVRPHRDDKVLTAWNGLAIAAFARAGVLFADQELLAVAQQAADFITGRMVDEAGRLYRVWRRGQRAVPGFAEDYSFWIHALIELYQATFRPGTLELAHRFSIAMLELFEEGGDIRDSGADTEGILGRGRTLLDGALPAAGSMMAWNLIRLAGLCADNTLADAAGRLLRSRLGQAGRQPTAYAQLLIALDHALGPTQQLAICCGESFDQARPFLHETGQRFLPRLVTLVDAPGIAAAGDPSIRELTAVFEDRHAGPGHATAFLCADQRCDLPAATAAELAAQLDRQLMRR